MKNNLKSHGNGEVDRGGGGNEGRILIDDAKRGIMRRGAAFRSRLGIAATILGVFLIAMSGKKACGLKFYKPEKVDLGKKIAISSKDVVERTEAKKGFTLEGQATFGGVGESQVDDSKTEPKYYHLRPELTHDENKIGSLPLTQTKDRHMFRGLGVKDSLGEMSENEQKTKSEQISVASGIEPGNLPRQKKGEKGLPDLDSNSIWDASEEQSQRNIGRNATADHHVESSTKSEIKRFHKAAAVFSRRMQPTHKDTKLWLEHPCGVLPEQIPGALNEWLKNRSDGIH